MFAGLAAQLIVRLGFVTLSRVEAVEGVLWYKRVLPVGFAYALTLGFGNAVYLLLDVGFIQMLKSFTPVVILFTAYIARIESPNRPVFLSILVICVGTAATCSFTPQLSLLGLLTMFIAEFAESVRLILTQYLLKNLKFSVIEGQYVLSPASAFWLFLASVVLEFNKMRESGAFTTILQNPLTFMAASSMGLGINFLSYYVMQATSALTMKVLGTVRNLFTIVVGVLIYGEIVPPNQALGYAVALAGVVAYNMAKSGYWDTPLPPAHTLKELDVEAGTSSTASRKTSPLQKHLAQSRKTSSASHEDLQDEGGQDDSDGSRATVPLLKGVELEMSTTPSLPKRK
jgi:drug/metabolite transporter (DMT)-like permease